MRANSVLTERCRGSAPPTPPIHSFPEPAAANLWVGNNLHSFQIKFHVGKKEGDAHIRTHRGSGTCSAHIHFLVAKKPTKIIRIFLASCDNNIANIQLPHANQPDRNDKIGNAHSLWENAPKILGTKMCENEAAFDGLQWRRSVEGENGASCESIARLVLLCIPHARPNERQSASHARTAMAARRRPGQIF